MPGTANSLMHSFGISLKRDESKGEDPKLESNEACLSYLALADH